RGDDLCKCDWQRSWAQTDADRQPGDPFMAPRPAAQGPEDRLGLLLSHGLRADLAGALCNAQRARLATGAVKRRARAPGLTGTRLAASVATSTIYKGAICCAN